METEQTEGKVEVTEITLYKEVHNFYSSSWIVKAKKKERKNRPGTYNISGEIINVYGIMVGKYKLLRVR